MSLLGRTADSLLPPPRARTSLHRALLAPTSWVDARQRDRSRAFSLSKPLQCSCPGRYRRGLPFRAVPEASPVAQASPVAASVVPRTGAPDVAGHGAAASPEVSGPEPSAPESSAPESSVPEPQPPRAGLGRASRRASSAPRGEVSAGVKVPSKASVKRAKDFQIAREVMENGKLWNCPVEKLNEHGALLRFGSALAFLPYSQMESRPGASAASPPEGLVGTVVKVKVIDVDESAKRLVVSERKAQEKLRFKELVAGQVYDGEVSSTVDYGVFVRLLSCDGSPLGVSGLVHKTELSWDAVPSSAAFVSKGQKVRVKLLRNKGGKVALSMKQVDSDPLFSTLDSLLPASTPDKTAVVNGTKLDSQQENGLPPPQPAAAGIPQASGGELLAADSLLRGPLPGLPELCESLKSQQGVTGVSMGRQVLEPRVVSQDLELWLSNVPVMDGEFTLVARAGRQVQEVFVKSTLDREGMKKAVLAVTDTIP